MLQILYLLLEGLSVIVPALLAVAFMTIIERKALAATQRRVGPNTVGYYGVLQPLNLCNLNDLILIIKSNHLNLREVIILSII
jgi:NADH:ubiquinone oxidoreductase subunit H